MNFESAIVQLIGGAVIVDVLVEFVKVVFNRYFKTKDIKCKNIVLRSISIFIGIIISIFYELDFPAVWGMSSKVAYVGYIITGIIISRGSNTLHDTLKRFGFKNTKL